MDKDKKIEQKILDDLDIALEKYYDAQREVLQLYNTLVEHLDDDFSPELIEKYGEEYGLDEANFIYEILRRHYDTITGNFENESILDEYIEDFEDEEEEDE